MLLYQNVFFFHVDTRYSIWNLQRYLVSKNEINVSNQNSQKICTVMMCRSWNIFRPYDLYHRPFGLPIIVLLNESRPGTEAKNV